MVGAWANELGWLDQGPHCIVDSLWCAQVVVNSSCGLLPAVNNHAAAATQAGHKRLNDAHRERGGDCRVDGVTTLLEDPRASLRRQRMHRNYHPILGCDLVAGRNLTCL